VRGISSRLRPPRRIKKPWGYEIIWAITNKYAGKILHIRRGEALSLQSHRKKDESIYLYSGALMIELEKNGRIVATRIGQGSAVRITPGMKHRLTALRTSTVFEVSTPHLSDVVRFEDRYGRV